MKIRNREKETFLFITLIFFSLIFMGLDKLDWLDWLKKPAQILSNPIRKRIHNLSRNFQFSTYQPKRRISNFQKNSSIILQEKANSFERENADLKVKLFNLEKENDSMRKLLGAPLSPSWKFIPAQVLSIKNGIMVINQGTVVGIEENQIVVFENVLIGRIIKVDPYLSKIRLPFAKDSNIKVKVIGNNGRGVIIARAEGFLILDKILPEVSLAKGQIVVTSAEDEVYPSDLLIGKVSEVEKDETAIYQKAIIEPLVDYQNLTEVFIIKN